MVTYREEKYTTPAHTKLFLRIYEADVNANSVVISHGLGEHGGRYEDIARRFVSVGLNVYVPDQRGFGRTSGKRGHVPNFNIFLQDINFVVKMARENSKKVGLLGHSLGGLIAARYAEEYNDIDILILSSGAFYLDEKTMPKPLFILVKILSFFSPSSTFSNGLDPRFLSHDEKVVKKYVTDPLVHDKISAKFVSEMLNNIKLVHKRADKIEIPVLIMLGTGDKMVEPEGSRQLYKEIESSKKSIIEYDGFYHETFNEPKKEIPIKDMVDFLNSHLSWNKE